MSEYVNSILNSKEILPQNYVYPIPVTREILKKNKLLAFDKKLPPEKLDVEWPFRIDKSPISHNNAMNSFYAIDFLVPIWTDILAVEDGEVWIIKEDSSTHWRGAEFGDKANYIIILHGDDIMSEYIHLDKLSITKAGLKSWDRVKKWQKIWETWLSGWLDIPHLHFALYKNIGWGNVKNIKADFKSRLIHVFLSFGI